ncbi:3-hydroxyacyl-CoA dehydrogenase family protein [bacterium]|nr:3-hydroxyacyl-CoA dehydrogenase family protein [candidate division CSSED10-310 bacterium]
MEIHERLREVAVIGAGGKMGSGIAVLLAAEMGRRMLLDKEGPPFKLVLVDLNESALRGLRSYLIDQLRRVAEKSMVSLRSLYEDRADLVENGEILQQHLDDVMGMIRFSRDLSSVMDCRMVFEAIIEDEAIKIGILTRMRELCADTTFFFTNTSSVPIHRLDDGAGLDGRIIGFHFYNPPVVQKLVEVIATPRTDPELVETAKLLGRAFRKKLVPANDIAGFIGNGHFIRDGLHALQEVERLMGEQEWSMVEAVYAVNRVSQDYLMRPMGIFQLIDYVGIDVFRLIQVVMENYIGNERLRHHLIDSMLENGVRGGQHPDGSQRDGFLRYERGRPSGVFDLAQGGYVAMEIGVGWNMAVDETLGLPPRGLQPWKQLLGDPDRASKIAACFSSLAETDTLGADIARRYLKRSRAIGELLVESGVADKPEYVNDVLTNGFFHLYGPINDFVV